MTYFEEYFVAAIHAVLKDRELGIIDKRYGLSDSDALTLQEIGDIYEISRERVRQLINRALRHVRTKGYSELKKEHSDHPAAQLITYLKTSIQAMGGDEDEAILDFIETELAHLPALPCLGLVNYLVTAQSSDVKPRLSNLKHRLSQRRHNRRLSWQQGFQLSNLLEGVIWSEKVVTWERHKFEGHLPKRCSHDSDYGNSGKFFSQKLQREVSFASSLERRYLERLERLDEVIYYLEQPLSVSYEYDGRTRLYYPDVFFLLKDGRGVVVEIKPIFQMAMQINLAKWSALRQFCAQKGFGMIVTDGRHFIQEVQQTPVRPEFLNDVMTRLSSKSLNWPEYRAIQTQFDVKRDEFVALVLTNRLKWRLGPFSLSLT